MPTHDKIWTLNTLRHAQQAFLISLTSLGLLPTDAIFALRGRVAVLKEDWITLNANEQDRTGKRYELPYDQVINLYESDQEKLKAELQEFYKFVRRNLIKESFEAVKAYSDFAGVEAALKTEPWYQFARICRNAISHDFVFNFNAGDLKKLPVSWENITIDASMQGADITPAILNPFVTVTLIAAMKAFADSH